jgi:hydroxymethylpyrimidine/phosphomethylpyrimidine kinase
MIQPITPEVVSEQIRLLFRAFPIGALKTGMLYSRAIIEAVCDTLEEEFATLPAPPLLVVDPVMVASSGDALLEPEAIAAYRDRLFPLAALVTPNLDEVRTLLGRAVTESRKKCEPRARNCTQLMARRF